MSDKFIPQLGGYYLNIVSISDSFPFSIIKHEYPFSNRNKLENLGQNTRGYTVNCIFMSNPPITKGWDTGIAIFPTFNAFFNFKATLQDFREVFDFTHPKFGELSGFVENFTATEDDTREYVEVSFDFVEQVTNDESTYIPYIVPQQADGFNSTTALTTTKIEAAEKAAQTLAEFAGQVSIYKGKLDAYLNQIVSPATSIINVIDYTTDLPGELMKSINSAIDRVVQSFVTIRNSPTTFINNIILGVRQLKSTFTGVEAQYVHIMGASRVAYEAATVYSEDDEIRNEIIRKENTSTFDISGNYIGGDRIQSAMTVQELEQTLYEIRQLINEVILFDRENQALKDQANNLQKYINDIKLNREILETQKIAEQTLHTVALINGQSYQTAERILDLNPQIKNPNFSNGDIKVIVPRS